MYQNLQDLLDYGEKDALTELLNRKSFDSAFLRATVNQDSEPSDEHPNRRATQDKGCFWLAMIDIDHFKPLNDHLGHQAGDQVLRELGQLMQTHTRQGDVVTLGG